jgi:hypothetical protein
MNTGKQLNKIEKVYLFVVHQNSKGVLHATSWAVMSEGCFTDNHSLNELWTYITLTQKE